MVDLAEDVGSNFADNEYWEPDCPPVGGLLPESDEFGGSALNAAWSLWRPGGAGSLTVSVGDSMVELAMATAATEATGIFKPIPTGLTAFSFAAKLSGSCVPNASAARYGIMIGQDLAGAPLTADTRSAGPRISNDGTAGVVAGSMAQWDAAYTESTNLARRDCSCYVRGRLTGIGTAPVVSWEWSDDGNCYQGLQTAVATFAPVTFGLWLRNVAGVPLTMRCEWFRVMAGDVGLLSKLPGGRAIPFT